MYGHNLMRDRLASISDSSQEYSERKHVIDDVISTLSQNLSTLHDIRNDWDFGIGNSLLEIRKSPLRMGMLELGIRSWE